MRMHSRRRLLHWTFAALVVVFGLGTAASQGWAQPTTTTARAGWRVGGGVTAVARLGNVLYIGGGFRGIAPEPNAGGGMLAVDAVSGLPVPGFPGFGGGVAAMEPDGAGGWFVGGNFLDVVGDTVQVRFRLAHVLANGDLDPAWTPTPEGGAVRALRLVPGVGLFVGGDFTALSGTARARVGLLDPVTGTVLPWTYNVAGGGGQVRTLAHDAGTLFIGGSFATVDGMTRPNFAAVSAIASDEVGPDLGVAGPVDVIAPASVGTLYLGGSFTTLKGQPRARLGRVTHAAGEIDVTLDSWNPGADNTVRAFAFVDASIFVGGDFQTIGGQPVGRLARVDAGTGAIAPEDFDLDGNVSGLAVSGTTVYVVGSFAVVQNQSRGGAAAFSASGQLLSWNPSPAGTPTAVAVNGSQVGIAGNISGYGALPIATLAALDLQTGQILPWVPLPNGNSIDEIVIHGNVVFVSGNFTEFDDQGIRTGLAALDAYTAEVLAWNPSPNGPVTGMVADGTYLYVGGNFTMIDGQPRNRMARFRLTDLTLDPVFAPNVTPAGGQINDLVVAGTTLYTGGGLFSVNGGPATRLAAFDTTTGAQIGSFAVSPNGPVNRMDFDNGFLYFTGTFQQVNEQPRQFLAKVEGTTGALQPWSPGPLALDAASVAAGFQAGTNDVDAQGDTVLITGAFSTVGGQPRLGVAQVNATDGALTGWAPNLGTPPTGGFGGPILSAPDFTAIGGARIQLADDLLNGLALFIEPGAQRPLPPASLTAEIVGTTVTIRWTTAPLGLAPASFILEAGSALRRADIAQVPVTGTSFTATDVPSGTYYVRVRAVTALGTSGSTDDLAVTVGGVGCSMPPQTPAITFAEADGSDVFVFWFGWAGAAPTSFVLEAGSGPGLSNLATLTLNQPPPAAFSGIPPGVYYLRVRSQNACGTSAPSPEFILAVGGVPAPPLPPFGLTGSSAGGVVSLQWLASASSTATGYRLEAGSTAGASNLAVIDVPGTTFSTSGVPPGVYFVRVRAISPAGVSAPSSELVLVVP